MQWYYALEKQRHGPVGEEEFERLVREGIIKLETLVWRQGMTAWSPYAAVAPATPAAPTAPAPAVAGAGDEETEVCAVSGKRHPKREMIQYEGRWISAEHRDAFFQRLREGVTQPGKFTYGSFGRRFCAKFLDGLIIGFVSIAKTMLLVLLFFGRMSIAPGPMKPDQMPLFFGFQALNLSLGIGLAVLYAWFFISRFDATPGKMALSLKILRPDGARLSAGRIIGRYFAEWISAMMLCIGYLMAGFDDERRALHDRICDTRVVKIT